MTLENHGGYWTATGNGYTRPIITEGRTRSEAFHAYVETDQDQYAEAQTLSGQSSCQSATDYESATHGY